MKTLMRTVLVALLGVGATFSTVWASEFRGLYVDAFHPGFKTHEETTQMVNAAKAANFNALIVQVRKRGDAYYKSSLEPRAADVAADYDPLADVIEQAHAAGLEVHAWLSVYEVSHESYTPASTHICKAHPEWLTKTRDGKTILDKGRICVDPGIPAVQDHIVALVLDVLKNYEVDGIHLDNPRYLGTDSGYNDTSIKLFNHQLKRTGVPEAEDAAWRQWRVDQVTSLVRKVHDTIAATKPKVKFSASVSLATPAVARNLFAQDWGVWMRDGLVDSVVPMLYLPWETYIQKYSIDALQSAHGRHVYIGIGSYALTAEVACKQIEAARSAGTKGVALYSYHYLGPNSGGTSSAKMANLAAVFSESASIPAMPWKE